MVTTLTFPDAECSRENYSISSLAMSQAGQHLLKLELVRLAQVHTHPGRWIDHSPWDDAQRHLLMFGGCFDRRPGVWAPADRT